MKILVTGSLGLVGAEACHYYLERGHEVIGVDNDMRATLFGPDGSGLKNLITHPRYRHLDIDITNCSSVIKILAPQVIIHCAAQPSHDWAASRPLEDFRINAFGTLGLLEATRLSCREAVFIHVSTNKVYGDAPNLIALLEGETRYESYLPGIDEAMSIDQSTHSLFGCSKLAADIYAQEYGAYFGLRVGIFRCGCITGSRHAAVEQHGFLAYMAKCKRENKPYTIYGYNGKQVRDNIHASDLVSAFDEFISAPRGGGQVYNMGGGRHSNVSVLEAMRMFGLPETEYCPTPRKGDHKWYISDVSKFSRHYPAWDYTYDTEGIIEDLISIKPV